MRMVRHAAQYVIYYTRFFLPEWRNGRRSGLKIRRGVSLVRVRVPSPAPLEKGRKIRGFGGFLGVGGVGTLWYGRMENMLCISIREGMFGGGSVRGTGSGIEGVARRETRSRQKNLRKK